MQTDFESVMNRMAYQLTVQ